MDEEKKVKKTTTTKSTTKKAAAKSSTGKKSTTAKKTSGVKKTATKNASGTKNESVKKPKVKKENETKVTAKKSVAVKKTTTKKTASKPLAKKDVSKEKEVEKKEIKSKVLEETIVSEVEVPNVESVSEPREEVIFETRKTIKKVIPVSNYLIAAIVLVWVIIIAYVGYELSRRHQENLYQEGYFIHEKIDIQKITMEESKKVSHDSKDAIFILYNYRGYEETYNLEKELYKIIKDYHLENSFYYVDLTDENGTINCDMTCVLNTGLKVNKFKNVPAIAYYERGTLIDVAQRDDQKVLESADFVKLLDMYEFRR